MMEAKQTAWSLMRSPSGPVSSPFISPISFVSGQRLGFLVLYAELSYKSQVWSPCGEAVSWKVAPSTSSTFAKTWFTKCACMQCEFANLPSSSSRIAPSQTSDCHAGKEGYP